jgi:hypothetical protein
MTKTEEIKLTCTAMVRVFDSRDNQGKPRYYHKRCGAPASEVEVGGTLAKARAVLCASHAIQADRESFASENGYPLGKVDKTAKEQGYKQPRLPGTGITGK